MVTRSSLVDIVVPEFEEREWLMERIAMGVAVAWVTAVPLIGHDLIVIAENKLEEIIHYNLGRISLCDEKSAVTWSVSCLNGRWREKQLQFLVELVPGINNPYKVGGYPHN